MFRHLGGNMGSFDGGLSVAGMWTHEEAGTGTMYVQYLGLLCNCLVT